MRICWLAGNRLQAPNGAPSAPPGSDPPWVRALLIGSGLTILGLVLFLPLAVVFVEAFAKGVGTYWQALRDPDTLAAIRLTLQVAASAVAANTLFGLAAAWCLSRAPFPGRRFLEGLIDLPFTVSPVIAGLVFVLLFGRQGWLGPWLAERGWQVIFAPPGIVVATLFVTLPIVAKELIPLMRGQGTDEEEGALAGRAGLAGDSRSDGLSRGHPLRHPAHRCEGADPPHAGPGDGRGGGGPGAGGQRLADLLEDHPPPDPAGPAVRRHPLQRPGHGGVWGGVGGPRARPGRDQHWRVSRGEARERG